MTKVTSDLSGKQDGATGLLDLLLGGLRHELRLHHDRLRSVHHALSEHLEVAVLSHVDDRNVAGRRLVLGLLREHRPEPLDVDHGAVELVAEAVEVAHADLAEVARVILVEENAVVVHATGVSAPAGMLTVLADTAVAGGDVAPLLPVLLQAGRHGGGWGFLFGM
ncbi:hypothetical protein RJ640_016076 [Escallonia rubra]|uniref:Uncharacterized protein n=1 Tax=Escallonia rubra TaxID=112253 RepID=A0AA88UIK8_9ASTE|nr:hypothetical protein RJ640_016076 [Escallonia rubra]